MCLLNLKNKLNISLKVLQKYKWLLDFYVLDFYVDDHWSSLSSSWQKLLDDIAPETLCELLDEGTYAKTTFLWPLELLCLRQVLQQINLSRKCADGFNKLPTNKILTHTKLQFLFQKSVKVKKRHEIERMAAICQMSCERTPVDFIVDFGAGLGHLARVLGYAHGIRVCCLEMQTQLNEEARKIDERLESIAVKYLTTEEVAHFQRPTHVDLCLTAQMTTQEFLERIRAALQIPENEQMSFGIMGLHACGDLGAILMRMFLNCAEAKFLNFVGCCYMKLSDFGYPLSDHLKKQGELSALSWEAREISCHASEMYYDRLYAADYEHLKVHSFRAATERILVKHWPHLKHAGLKSVKHTPGMLFVDYFYKAVNDIPEAMGLGLTDLNCNVVQNDLKHWKRIVIFYTLRLMLAPLVESIILFDRLLFLQENHCEVNINAIFDPRLSPRNHITTAIKTV